MPEQVQFVGLIDTVLFNAKDSGWSVLLIHPEDGLLGRNTVPVTGVLFEPRVKDRVRVKGEWTRHAKYGKQIKAETISMIMPDSAEGICKLLQSKQYLSGVGKKTAERIVQEFGADSLKVLEKTPEKLLKVKGISQKKLSSIVKEFSEKTAIRDILQFCAENNIPQSQGIKIQEVYGNSAVSIIKRNPYLLTESNKGVKGIGFKKADAMALSQNLPKDSWDRLSHGVCFALTELTEQKGGTAVPKNELIEYAAEMMDVPQDNIHSTLFSLLSEDNPRIIEDKLDGEICEWNFKMYNREKYIAKACHDMLSSKKHSYRLPAAENIDAEIKNAEEFNGIELADMQKKALQMALKGKLSVITGGPGVGKTTIIRCLINTLEKFGNTIRLAAPTGRAAKRMKEATGHDASTIHRLLEVGPDGMFKRNEDNPLDEDVFIIDESSMIDTTIMYCLLKAIPSDRMLVLVGDVDQLPSVGPGKVLEDIINSAAVPVSRLKTIFRQAAESKIITAAHSINEGNVPEIKNDPHDDFFFIETKDNSSCAKTVMNLVDYIPKKFSCDPLWDVQVLSPKKASEVGTDSLNMILQEYYIPDVRLAKQKAAAEMRKRQHLQLSEADQEALNTYIQTPVYIGKNNIFAVGDKVMQIKNNYSKGVYNGDIGQITRMYLKAKDGDTFAEISYQDETGVENVVGYTRNELWKEITLAYACTIHKSQGSEYPYVIIPLMPTFSIMLQKKLLYTGITRGKKLVCIVGTKDALTKCVKDYFKNIVSIRRTKLKFWLQIG